MVMKSLLERKIPISFTRICCSCKKNEEYEIPEMTESSNIELEHRFEYNGTKIADVAYTDNGDIFCIFEIYHTHKTRSENRPEPWFEIDAETLIKLANKNSISHIKMPCVRCENCDDCIIEKLEVKRKIRALVESKSNANESSHSLCSSTEIMKVLVDIISGDDAYKEWSGIYRCWESEDEYLKRLSDSDGEHESGYILEKYTPKDIIKENDIYSGYCDFKYCDTYYDKRLIEDIQSLHLHKYLKSLYVDRGVPAFTFCGGSNVSNFQADSINKKLRILCNKIFGVYDDDDEATDAEPRVRWEYKFNGNYCGNCGGIGGGVPRYGDYICKCRYRYIFNR